jgi:hypothetical protein
MTCDEGCAGILREIAGEPGDADSRAHVSACPTCAQYRREADHVWRHLGTAVESCPARRNVFAPGKRKRSPSAVAAVAAALIAAASLLVWATRPAAPAILTTAARQDPDEEMRKQVLRVAQQEKERLAEFEKKLGAAEKGLSESRGLLDDGKVGDAANRAEDLLRSFPKLKLAVLEAAALEHRALLARARLREVALLAQIRLLKQKPEPQDAAGVEERAEIEIRLHNRLRETLRELEELTLRGPQPKKDATVELGGGEPSLQKETLDKLKSIRITINMDAAPLSTAVSYIREITGLKMVVVGKADAPVSLQLQDVPCEAALEYMVKLAGAKLEVDRFGIIQVTAAKK